MIRFIYIGFIILFSFCSVFGGHDGSNGFIWQLETHFITHPFFDLSFGYIVFYLPPFIGQALLITGIIGGAAYIKSVVAGLVLLDITCACLFVGGVMLLNIAMIFTPLIFMILSGFFINYYFNHFYTIS